MELKGRGPGGWGVEGEEGGCMKVVACDSIHLLNSWILRRTPPNPVSAPSSLSTSLKFNNPPPAPTPTRYHNTYHNE